MMPFRVPESYRSLMCPDIDCDRSQLAHYVAWLERELYLAREALNALICQPKPSVPKPKPDSPTPEE